ncbi:MAG: hypothetical protein U0838_07415 [Chloroflexota bacterium]
MFGFDQQVVLNSLVLGVIVMLAYLAGAITLPVVHIVSAKLQGRTYRRRSHKREDIEALRDLLPDLQKAAEQAGDPASDRRFLDLNTEVVFARDKVASKAIRDAVAAYQHDAVGLVEFRQQEAQRPPLLDQRGEVSGQEALGRMFAALKVRQDAFTALSEAMSAISDELRRL